MQIQNLDNDNLMSRFEKLVRTERKITHLVLDCIREIECRKLYLEKAYPSLFEFLVKGYGYSPGAAMRRIDGARLVAEIPEIAEKLEEGSINLSQITLLQKAARDVQKTTNQKVSVECKRELLEKIANQGQRQTEQTLAEDLGVSVSTSQAKCRSDGNVTLNVTLTKEQMEILESAKASLSHSVPGQEWAEVFVYMAKKEIGRRFNTRVVSQDYKKSPTVSSKQTFTTVAIAQSRQRRVLSSVIRKHVLHKNSTCDFVDRKSGRRCSGRHFLQIDHIHSVSRGGRNEIENLQVLCAYHNRWKYESESQM